MAKNFHYFKFIATEWLTGDIVFEDFELQGIFINICAIYWHRDGEITLTEIKKRFKTERIAELTDRFISVSEDFISIKFLDEQLRDVGHVSKVNSENGKLGGRPKKNKVEHHTEHPKHLKIAKLTEYKPETPDGTHTDFAKKIMSVECELDRTNIRDYCKKEITIEVVKQFNAFCGGKSKVHPTFKEWKSHLMNWYNLQKVEVKTPTKYKELE